MTQLPGYNLYAIHKRELSSALLTSVRYLALFTNLPTPELVRR